MKKLAIAVIVILLALGAGLWFLANGSLNPLVKEQIEIQGSKYTEQTVKVGEVDIKLFEGFGSIRGLTVTNPEGFKQPHAISLGDITLDINIESLANLRKKKPEAIVIDQIKIADPKAFVELNQQGSTNFNQIIDAINKNLPKSSGSEPAPEQTPSGQAEPKIKVTELTVSGVALALDLTALGNKEHQVTLADIQLNNIGDEQGLPASQLGGEIAKQVIKAIANKAKDEQKRRIKEKAVEKIKEKAKEKLGGLLDKLKG